MKSISEAWRTSWRYTKSRRASGNLWCAWPKSRSCCTKTFALRKRCRPGRVARRDGEYQRCGTANVFCGVEPKAGRYFPKVTRDRSSPEFADYLLDLATRYPQTDTIHLVMDNLSSHTRKAVVERLGEKAGGWLWSRFTVHYTPKHGSWLNQAEIAISLFSRQCMGQRRIGDRVALRQATQAWGRRKKARHFFDYTITRSQY
jgi:transposase